MNWHKLSTRGGSSDGNSLAASDHLPPGGGHLAYVSSMDIPSQLARFWRFRRIYTRGLRVCLVALVLGVLGTSLYPSAQSNDDRALNSMRAISLAELMYEATYPANGYACSLAALGGDPKLGPPSPLAAQLINNDLASGIDHGYIFKIGNCTKVTIHGTDRIVGFKLTAVPQIVGKTGHRGFCTDQLGVFTVDPTGGTNCTEEYL